VDWNTALEELSVGDNGQATLNVSGGNGIEVSSPCVVVFTQPVPQVLGSSKYPVRGNFLEKVDEATSEHLKKVEYSSRFAAAYYFEKTAWPFSWTAQYFGEGDVRYVAHDTGKRGAKEEPWTSVVVHSAVPLGIQLADEQEPFPAAAERMVADLEKKLPEIPWREASATKVHKWKYSQVYKGYGGARPSPDWTWDEKGIDTCTDLAPGCIPLFKTDQCLGMLCGDAVAPASKFDGCVFSAYKGAEAIKAFFKEQLSAK